MEKLKQKKSYKLISVFVALVLLLSLIPIISAAETSAQNAAECSNHATHNEECGYVEEVAAQACEHEHDEACEEECTHEHDASCGYTEAAEGQECQHVCATCDPATPIEGAQTQELVFSKEETSPNHSDIAYVFTLNSDEFAKVERSTGENDSFGNTVYEELVSAKSAQQNTSLQAEYAVDAGGSEVTLNKEYLNTLDAGTNEFRLSFKSGAELMMQIKVEESAALEEEPAQEESEEQDEALEEEEAAESVEPEEELKEGEESTEESEKEELEVVYDNSVSGKVTIPNYSAGMIYDETTGEAIGYPQEPVANYAVYVYDAKKRPLFMGMTNENGEYTIENIEPGEYYIQPEYTAQWRGDPSEAITITETGGFAGIDFEMFVNFRLFADTTVSTAIDLQAALNQALDGDTITVANDIDFASSGVILNRTVLTGSGVTITSAAGGARTLSIASGLMFTITRGNITFDTINLKGAGDGGNAYTAVATRGIKVDVSNAQVNTLRTRNANFSDFCEIVSVYTPGAAIQMSANWNSTTALYIDGGTFANNTSSRGGAVYAAGDFSNGYNGTNIPFRFIEVVSIKNARFENNVANGNKYSYFGLEGNGGAVFAASGTCELIDCTFVNNSTDSAKNSGGAVWYSGRLFESGSSAPIVGSLLVQGCEFDSNKTGYALSNSGGALSAVNSTNISLIGSTFANNYSTGNGGAVYFGHNIQNTITDCSFDSNSSAVKGGAVQLASFNFLNPSKTTISNSRFTNNLAGAIPGSYGSAHGGAVYVSDAPSLAFLKVSEDTYFADNEAKAGYYFYEGPPTQTYYPDIKSRYSSIQYPVDNQYYSPEIGKGHPLNNYDINYFPGPSRIVRHLYMDGTEARPWEVYPTHNAPVMTYAAGSAHPDQVNYGTIVNNSTNYAVMKVTTITNGGAETEVLHARTSGKILSYETPQTDNPIVVTYYYWPDRVDADGNLDPDEIPDFQLTKKFLQEDGTPVDSVAYPDEISYVNVNKHVSGGKSQFVPGNAKTIPGWKYLNYYKHDGGPQVTGQPPSFLDFPDNDTVLEFFYEVSEAKITLKKVIGNYDAQSTSVKAELANREFMITLSGGAKGSMALSHNESSKTLNFVVSGASTTVNVSEAVPMDFDKAYIVSAEITHADGSTETQTDRALTIKPGDTVAITVTNIFAPTPFFKDWANVTNVFS